VDQVRQLKALKGNMPMPRGKMPKGKAKGFAKAPGQLKRAAGGRTFTLPVEPNAKMKHGTVIDGMMSKRISKPSHRFMKRGL